MAGRQKGRRSSTAPLRSGASSWAFTTPGYDGWPLIMLRLAEVDVERLFELVTDAWRMRAPRELAADLDNLV